MPQPLLVPLDGSALSESALPFATAVARRTGVRLTLLSSGWGTATDELDAYLHRHGQALDVAWDATVVPDAFPATAIAKAAGDGDLVVVMATHGRSGLGKALLGSVAEDVLRASPGPVVLLGPSAGPVVLLGPSADPATTGATGPLVLATDGSATSAEVIDHAAAWAGDLGLDVDVVAVVRADGTATGGGGASELGPALDEVAARLRQRGLHAEVNQVRSDDAAGALVARAREVGAPMVAIGTHGRTGLARTALGSTAMKVVRESPCPVLVHRP